MPPPPARTGASFGIFPSSPLLFFNDPDAGAGMVGGLTRNGVDSRWGEARKEKDNCWAGRDFRIRITENR